MSEQTNRGARGARGAQVVGNESSRDEVAIVRPGSQPVEHERPEDWGWHGATGKWGQIGGWLTVVIMMTYLIGNHEGRVEDLWVVGTALTMAGVLVWDLRRKKTAWRN